MPDFDLERLDAAFAGLRSAATDQVRPPGLAAARATLRRRRRNRVVALCVAVLAAVVVPAIVFRDTRPPVITPEPTPSQSASPSPSPMPSASASPSSTPSGSPSGSPVGPRSASTKKLTYAALFATSDEVNSSVEVPRTAAFSFPIGVTIRSGTAHNMRVTVDGSGIAAKVSIVSAGSRCTVSGSQAVCNLGTLSAGTHMFGQLTLRARPGVSAGSAGTLKLLATADETSTQPFARSSRITVYASDNMADLVAKSPSVGSGKVGSTVRSTITLTNRGPAKGYPQLFAGNGVTPVSASGCTLYDDAPRGWLCNLTLDPGSSATLSVTYTITSCEQNGEVGPFINYSYAPHDPLTLDMGRDWPRLLISGC